MKRAIASAALAMRRAELSCPHARLLIEALNVELAARYPEPGANHFRLDAEEVAAVNGAFLIGYWGAEPVACGAIRRLDTGVAEVKRMYVVPSARGCGVSKIVLAALEERARELGFARLVLETGTRQLDAIGLYQGAGFHAIPLFGEYLGSQLSLCFAKDLK
jgi:putative acetyltransferase